MRVLQIIDSLDPGGAERMAINYANALVPAIEFSGLIATRKEGGLKNSIEPKVSYMFLQKKKRIDLKAVFRLRSYIVKNEIDVVHAHGSSFFIAVLVKFILPGIKIIWHDHYGSRAKETRKENRVLIFLSVFFSSIFVVNLQLKDWNKKNLRCSRVVFIPNFAKSKNISEQITLLEGESGKRVVFLANLKNPKNHILVLKAFSELKLNELGWSLHLIGRDYYDNYSDVLKNFIKSNLLESYVHFYGERNDIKYILSQASIGVLASKEEGFPVTLLEYGLENLAVISTNVGYCSTVIKNGFNGLLFDPSSCEDVKLQLRNLVEDESLRKILGRNFKESILEQYSEEVVIKKLIKAYKITIDER